VALLGHIRDRGLTNIRIWNDDARPLLDRLAPASIARAFVLFPDPWPKARHHKRRLIQAPFLDALARVLAPGAEFRLASDHADYVEWMLERVPVHPAFRLAQRYDTRPADWPETRYEAWSVGEGRKPAYLSFTPGDATPVHCYVLYPASRRARYCGSARPRGPNGNATSTSPLLPRERCPKTRSKSPWSRSSSVQSVAVHMRRSSMLSYPEVSTRA
jgi:hypothetical protein